MRGTMTERSPGTWRLRVVTGYDALLRRRELVLLGLPRRGLVNRITG